MDRETAELLARWIELVSDAERKLLDDHLDVTQRLTDMPRGESAALRANWQGQESALRRAHAVVSQLKGELAAVDADVRNAVLTRRMGGKRPGKMDG